MMSTWFSKAPPISFGTQPDCEQAADLFPAKYPWWHPFVRDGEFYDPADTALSDPRHVYALEPAQVFAFGKEKGFSATRWRFQMR